jgi:hypothetical protein
MENGYGHLLHYRQCSRTVRRPIGIELIRQNRYHSHIANSAQPCWVSALP